MPESRDDRPTTRFLGHSLIHHDGETQGEKAARQFGASGAAYADTLRRFPPTRVSIEEFERDMAGSLPSSERDTP